MTQTQQRADGTYTFPKYFREDTTSTTQTIVNSINTVVTFDVNKINTNNPFTYSAGVFTCQVPGNYQINYQIGWAGHADTKSRVTWIQTNGDTSRRYGTYEGANVSGDPIFCFGSYIIAFKKGDTFSIIALDDATNVINVGGADASTTANRIQMKLMNII